MEINKNEVQELIDNKIKAGEKKYGKDFKYYILEILSLEKMLNPEKKESRIIPLAEWNNYHSYPTTGSLRQFQFNNTDNFRDCSFPSGGRIMLYEDKVLHWIENRSKNKLKKA